MSIEDAIQGRAGVDMARDPLTLRVMIVDDDPFLAELLMCMLGMLGVSQVVAVSDGQQVLQALDRGDVFDLMISDLNMPGMDGVQVMRHLAGRGFDGDLILLTGEDLKILRTAESLARAHRLRVLGILRKPVERETLARLLQQACTRGEPASLRSSPEVSVEELRQGIESGALLLHYQPRVSVVTRQVVGVESLVRWQHPVFGLLYPNAFIALAESSGLIEALTHAVIRLALEQGRDWQAAYPQLKIAVNMPAGLFENLDLPDQLVSLLDRYGFPATNLVLEITESQLMDHLIATLDTLIRLRLKGVTLAVDDFGTGYSNLGQIKRAPFGEFKIDRSFVQGALQDEEGLAILETSILLGRKLGLTVVAEGVETEQEWETVARLGADEVQGYFVARPMPGAQLPDWITAWNAR
jgi:EAL domain-containing protein (putative c-di-GMP-specific phosphodiesterase class I)/CheY-like chemotaxis protein